MQWLTPLYGALPQLLWFGIWAYMAVAALYILMENKSPPVTFAWYLLFILLPLIGVVIYVLFGREQRAFTRQRNLLRQEIFVGLRDEPIVKEFFVNQSAEREKLADRGPLLYRRMLQTMKKGGNAILFSNNHVEILRNAQEKYPRLMEDIQKAKHSIHMEYFEWSSDETMQEFKAALIARAKAGVEVRILYDPLGCFSMLKWSYVHDMNANGVKMVPWSRLYAVHTFNYRNHRKIAVIDGKVGYTGGLNMSEEYLFGPHDGNFTGWRDTHARITGQVVVGLQTGFAVQWFNTTGEKLVDPPYFHSWDNGCGYLPVQIVNSGPDAEWKAIRSMYFAMITAAEKCINIQSPFFILDEGLMEALAGAARAGVDVKVMLAPRGPGTNAPYYAARTYMEALAKVGVQFYFYEGDYFHIKMISVDNILSSIGSANMDIRSFAINYELNLLIYDADVTAQLNKDFLNDLENCLQFTSTEYQRMPFIYRVRDSFMRLFSPLM